MDDSLTKLKCRVCKYERVYRRSKAPENKGVYKNLRRVYRSSLRFNKKNYVNRMIEECGHDAKKLYSTANNNNNNNPFYIAPDKSDYIIPKVLHMVHHYYPSSSQALCHSFVRGSHILPSQLPGEHTGHKAASRCSEPIWNACYSSTHHHCHVPILHLGEVRHTWSSHLAQGCYSPAGLSHISHYGAMPAGESHIHVSTRLMIA